MTEPKAQTLDLPGATLTYDVREAESESTQPVLLMIGSPMDAGGFTTLAGHFPDRTVVTYDPRGVGRSPRADGVTAATPDQHAEDLHRLISELDAGPVDIFASSGGAVNALALVTRHPEGVRTLVAHEPPLATVLPDREEALAVTEDIHETYERDGLGSAMAKFIAFTSVRGPTPPDLPNHAPNPADVGLPAEDDGSRDHPLLGPHMVYVTRYEPDFDSLRRVSTRIVVAGGTESEGTFPYRAALAVAERLGTQVVIFPSHHGRAIRTRSPPPFAGSSRTWADRPATGARGGRWSMGSPAAHRSIDRPRCRELRVDPFAVARCPQVSASTAGGTCPHSAEGDSVSPLRSVTAASPKEQPGRRLVGAYSVPARLDRA
jgi:pimeloyl-ACP methyl ester carboxylesterase